MNKCIIIGRLTKNPEINYSQAEKPICIARYTVAVDRRFKKEGGQTADFIPCIAFGKQGEFAEKYLVKGIKIAVTGRIQTGSYTNKDGKKIYTTDVVVEEQEFVESKKASDTMHETTQESVPDSAQEQPSADGFMAIPDGIEEDLPFI